MDGALFGSDRPLLYTVSPWKELGFAVPNFGDNIGTLSVPIWSLADEIGKLQLFVMTHRDAQRAQFPSINTVIRICKLCNRVAVVLEGRMKRPSDPLLEGGHASANVRPWNVHPVPYFPSEILQNSWLSEYNNLCMVAMTNIYQHSDNNLPLTITEQFARDVYRYFREIKMLIGSELLRIPIETLKADGFIFTQEHYDAYAPADVMVNMEDLLTPGAIFSTKTEDDLLPLRKGIAANLILTSLSQYPVDDGGLGYSGQPLPADSKIAGTADDSAVAPAGGTIGQPQI